MHSKVVEDIVVRQHHAAVGAEGTMMPRPPWGFLCQELREVQEGTGADHGVRWRGL